MPSRCLIVVGITLLMEQVGLSPALGTFLAGVVLAESEYRHELEKDLEPFKGLLLAVFFIAVGAGIDFPCLLSAPILIAGLLVLGFIARQAHRAVRDRPRLRHDMARDLAVFLLTRAGR